MGCLTVSGTNLFAGTPYGIFLWTNNGTSWTAVDSGLTNTGIRSLAVSGTNLFAGTNGSGVFRSTDEGTSWTALDSHAGNAYVLALMTSGTNLFGGTTSGVFLSNNNGTSWSPAGLTDTIVQALAISDSNLFAGTYLDGVLRSTNNGTNWTQVNLGLPNTDILSLAVCGKNLFAGTLDDGVFLSTNDGATWTPVNTGLISTVIYTLTASCMNVFAGTDRGVFLSMNNGTSWTAVNSGLTETIVYALAVFPNGVDGRILFAGTHSGKVWKRPLAEMISSVCPQSVVLPTDFGLEQNYPNPFNPNTTINYELPTQSHLTLKVFDVLGKEIATLVNRFEQPGDKSVRFDASTLPSGVYYYRLQAGSYSKTKRLLLLK